MVWAPKANRSWKQVDKALWKLSRFEAVDVVGLYRLSRSVGWYKRMTDSEIDWVEQQAWRMRRTGRDMQDKERKRALESIREWAREAHNNGSSAICKAASDKPTWSWQESKSNNDVMDDQSFVEDQMDDWKKVWGGSDTPNETMDIEMGQWANAALYPIAHCRRRNQGCM